MKKAFIVAISVIFFFSLGLTLKASSQGEIGIIRYMKQNRTLYIEIKTPTDMKEVVLEILNDKDQVTHFFVLDKPITKKNGEGEKGNYFYITRNMAQFRQFHKIHLYSKNNRERVYIMKEIETAVMGQETRLKASHTNENPIKVMSYNIHHGKSLFGTHSIDTIAEIIAEADIDIVGLQEVDQGMLRSRFLNQAEHLGLKLEMNHAFGDNLNILGGKYGNAILSKYPIMAYENLSLPSGREQRGFLSATIDVKGKEIQFIVTHLGLNPEERTKQVDIIQRYIETIPREIILVGDFNALDDSPEIRSISRLMQDTGEITGKEDLPTFDLPILSKRIDYIFVGQQISVEGYEVIRSRASDHYPIHAELVLP